MFQKNSSTLIIHVLQNYFCIYINTFDREEFQKAGVLQGYRYGV